MSGVFLIVGHDDQYTDATVLRNTSGGYPHITFFYSGKEIDIMGLSDFANQVFTFIQFEKKTNFILAPENAQLNSFYHERAGKQRYDVLLHLDAASKSVIEQLRDTIIRHQIPEELVAKISMGPPHVTHSIHWSEADAQAALDEVRKHLPLTVALTGYTID